MRINLTELFKYIYIYACIHSLRFCLLLHCTGPRKKCLSFWRLNSWASQPRVDDFLTPLSRRTGNGQENLKTWYLSHPKISGKNLSHSQISGKILVIPKYLEKCWNLGLHSAIELNSKHVASPEEQFQEPQHWGK